MTGQYRKDQRKQFRRDVNPPIKQGDQVQGTPCLALIFPALCLALTFGVGLLGIYGLLP
jgi:hypothetical protein